MKIKKKGSSIGLRVEAKLHRWVMGIAKREGIPASAVIRRELMRAMEASR